jgi:hypothetical protein
MRLKSDVWIEFLLKKSFDSYANVDVFQFATSDGGPFRSDLVGRF